MKTIVQYNPRFHPCVGGGETYVSNLVTNIKEYSFEVVTNSLPGIPEEEYFSENVLVKRFPPNDKNLCSFGNPFIRKFSFPWRVFTDILRLQKKNKYLIKSTPNLVHFHGIGFCNNLLKIDMQINRLFFSKLVNFNEIKTPKIITIHNLFSSLNSCPILKAYEKFIIDQFDTIICVDKNIEICVKNYLDLTNKDKNIYFIPNSVDVHKFYYSKHELKENLNIGFVGRFEYSRGVSLLQLLIRSLPDFCELHITSNQVEGVNKSNVHFYGILPENDVPHFLRNVDVVFNPVLVEGISRITLEAMSCGRPVIMLNKGDRYPVINGKTGYLIKEDINELLSLLDSINTNREELQKLGQKGRKIIENEFSNEVVLKKIENIYQELI